MQSKTKNPLSLLLTLTLFLCALPMPAPAHAAVVPAGYTPIRTAADLNAMRDNLSASYYLLNGIDLNGWGDWEPVGQQGSEFKGIFDGNGFAISGLTVDVTGSDAAGLFGHVEGGEIRNLTLNDYDISGGIAGGIVGNASQCEISGCRNSASVTSGELAAASLVRRTTVLCRTAPTRAQFGGKTTALRSASAGLWASR